jgi:hypothetical protein
MSYGATGLRSLGMVDKDALALKAHDQRMCRAWWGEAPERPDSDSGEFSGPCMIAWLRH